MMYYDFVLGLIPFGLATIASTMFLSGFELTLAITVGSLFAVALIGHAMFVRAPVDPVPTVETEPAATADAGMVAAD
jgi:hypothetical protein